MNRRDSIFEALRFFCGWHARWEIANYGFKISDGGRKTGIVTGSQETRKEKSGERSLKTVTWRLIAL